MKNSILSPACDRTIQPLGESLWIIDDKFPLAKGFLPFGMPPWLSKCSTRTTLVGLGNKELLVHSPATLTTELITRIEKLGAVKIIVAPNVMHTSHVAAWAKAFPSAKVVCAPKTSKRNSAFAGVELLDEQKPLTSELEQVFMAGHRNQETLFFHKASKTLIATDLAYGIWAGADPVEKLFLKLSGVRGPIGVASYSRNKVTDQAQFNNSLRKVQAWDYKTVTMCHGNVVRGNAKEAFAAAWKFSS